MSSISRARSSARASAAAGLLAIVGVYHLAASLIFPDEPEQWPDFDDWYDRQKRMVIGGLLIRRMLRPMRQLAFAADTFGDAEHDPIPETGPREVRHVVAAFNRMAARIQRLGDGLHRHIDADPILGKCLMRVFHGNEFGGRCALIDGLMQHRLILPVRHIQRRQCQGRRHDGCHGQGEFQL